KLGHVFSELGNIAGDIFAPGVMLRIPGTQMNRQMQEAGLNNEIKGLEGAQSENELRGAQAGNLESETTDRPLNDESRRKLEGAQTEEAGNKVNNPDLATAYAHAVNQAIKSGADPAQDPIVQHLSDAITSIQKQAA